MAERRRALRLLGNRSLAGFWLALLLERTGDWLVLLTLLVMAWNKVGDASLAPWVLALWLSPRLIVLGIFGAWTSRLTQIAWPLLVATRAASVAAVIFIANLQIVGDSQLLLGAAGVLGFFAATATDPRSAALRARVGLGDLGAAVAGAAFLERLAVFVGAVVTGAILLTLEPAAALTASAVALTAGALVAFAQVRGLVVAGASDAPRPALQDRDELRSMARGSAIYLVAAFTSGALGAVLIIATLPLGAQAAGPASGPLGPVGATVAPLLIAAYAVGLLIGPLPVPRLLLRVGPATVMLSAVLLSSVISIAIVVTQGSVLPVLLLVLVGLSMVTLDVLRAIAIRRLVPPDQFERVTHLSLLALTAGQIYGAVGVVSLTRAPDPYAILVVLALSQVVLILFGIALGGRSSLRVGGLSSLPIKSVVHKLSWGTRPPAKPQDFTAASPRAQRLARWVNRQVQLQELKVTLPISKREYAIYRPDEESRERLFEQGRADPDKQMPYWAKVWPSGVALADVVVERKEEVAGQHVLELGAGLGVTACAVLEYGGHIVTADYSALPLAHCRLNTLVNTDRAPRATCFNWRHDPEVAAALAQPEFRGGFPLIIAGDVLYEGRDAEPLLNVIEKMLVADGSLWLAEPVRKTAQRFLDSAASLGWDIESRQVKAEWPDATDGPVNLHFLNRSNEMDQLAADLGGWRI
jgi:predicted nicotinamide N-methyase